MHLPKPTDLHKIFVHLTNNTFMQKREEAQFILTGVYGRFMFSLGFAILNNWHQDLLEYFYSQSNIHTSNSCSNNLHFSILVNSNIIKNYLISVRLLLDAFSTRPFVLFKV